MNEVTREELLHLLNISYVMAIRVTRSHDDEFLSEAHEAMFRAIKAYRPGGNKNMVQFVIMCVVRAVKHLQRKNYNRSAESFDESQHTDDHRNEQFYTDLVEALGKSDAELARQYFIEDRTVRELAHERGESEYLTKTRLERIRRRLRDLFSR